MAPAFRVPMLVNCAMSLASGLLIALAPSTVGGWLGVDVDGWLRVVGLVLIGHGLLLAWAANRPDPAALGKLAKLNMLAIAPYPVLMIVLVATGLIDRQLGQVLALIDGAVIGAIALWHWFGLRTQAPVRQPQHA